MPFKDFLKRFLSRKAHPAHLPYVPTPPTQQSSASANQPSNDASYTEEEATIHNIAGSSLNFGIRKIVQVDECGRAKDLTLTQSHIAGTGKLINKAEELAGICKYCQTEAIEAIEANLISLEQAEIRSMYDTSSASRCDICGTDTCCLHTRPVQMPNGSNQLLCVDCQKKLKGQILKQRIFGFLLSPFMEDGE